MENMSNPTAFSDDSARGLREAEVVDASFVNGMNLGGSNSMGVGINMSAVTPFPVVGTPEQFTLLDQDGDIRVGQRSQSIGGYPYADPADYPSSGGTEGDLPAASIYTGTNPTNDEKAAAALIGDSIDGTIVKLGNASLPDLDGWLPTA
jgi:hypothetical protein